MWKSATGAPADDEAWLIWHRTLWPGLNSVGRGVGNDPLYRVVLIPAITAQGRRAKAAAVFAAKQAGGYLDDRTDIHELMAIVMIEAAGAELIPVGQDCREPDMVSR